MPSNNTTAPDDALPPDASSETQDTSSPPEDLGEALLSQLESQAGNGRLEWEGGASIDVMADLSQRNQAEATAPAEAEAVAPDESQPAESQDEAPAPSSEASEETPAETQDETGDNETQPEVPVGGYLWVEGDEQQLFDDAQVREGLRLAAWARTLNDETRNAYAALEQGTAIAISREEYTAYNEWRSQKTKAARDSDLDNLIVDPDVAALISGLRDEVEALKAGPQPQSQGDANIDANLDATLAIVDRTAEAYANELGLSQQEVAWLVKEAADLNAFDMFMVQGAQVNPVTGRVERPADIALVTQQALNLVLPRNPVLYNRVQEHLAKSSTNTPQGESMSTAQADLALEAKKARASSVANAPSAAVTPASRKPMSSSEIVDAMAKDLAAAMSGE